MKYTLTLITLLGIILGVYLYLLPVTDVKIDKIFASHAIMLEDLSLTIGEKFIASSGSQSNCIFYYQIEGEYGVSLENTIAEYGHTFSYDQDSGYVTVGPNLDCDYYNGVHKGEANTTTSRYNDVMNIINSFDSNIFETNTMYHKEICGYIHYYDLGSIVDDPAYYIDTSNKVVLAECGGYESLGNENVREYGINIKCPPIEWIQCQNNK